MIAIPNMDKPKACIDCSVNDMVCGLWMEVANIKAHKHKDCPLIEVAQCKDCIYNSNNTDGDNRGWCYKHGIDIIGFCSEGEE